MKVLGIITALALTAVLCNTVRGASVKPCLVIEDKSARQESINQVDVDDFRRLLVNALANAKVFRCIDRSTYKTQAKEIALGDGDVQFQSAGYCVTWIIRCQESVNGITLTISLGYTNISRDGNGETIKSENVIVRTAEAPGQDLLTYASKKAARAILFSLAPAQVLDVTDGGKKGKTTAIISYGKDYFSPGDIVYFVEKKTKGGREFSKKVGLGKVRTVELDTSTVELDKGKVEEDDYIELKVDDSKNDPKVECPACNGARRIVTKSSRCDKCGGEGKMPDQLRRGIGGRAYVMKGGTCQKCFGKGEVTSETTCKFCSGNGKVLASKADTYVPAKTMESGAHDDEVEYDDGGVGFGPRRRR